MERKTSLPRCHGLAHFTTEVREGGVRAIKDVFLNPEFVVCVSPWSTWPSTDENPVGTNIDVLVHQPPAISSRYSVLESLDEVLDRLEDARVAMAELRSGGVS